MQINFERLLALTALLVSIGTLAAGCGSKEGGPSATGTATATGTAMLTWSANTESDVAGYKVYIGSASDTFGSLSSVANPTAPAFGSPISVGNATTFQVTNLPIGQTYKFAVTAVDTSGNESGFSNEASKFVGSGAPPVPLGQATTYYVATTGLDINNTCAQAMNEATPWRTINAGIACLAAGDTLIVKAGIYDEIFDNPFSNTGDSWPNKITVKAELPRKAIIKPTGGEIVMSFQSASQKYIEFDGIEIDAINITAFGVRIWGLAHHFRFKNSAILNAANQGVSILKDAGASPDFNEFINVEVAFTAMNANGTPRVCNGNLMGENGFCHGFYIGSDGNVLDGVHLHHNNGNGVQFFPAGNRGNTIRNSLSHDNEALGIVSIGNDNNVINNVVYNNKTGGISIRETNNRIYHNTIYNNPNEFDGLNLGGTGHMVKNNLLSQNTAVGMLLDSSNLVGMDPQFFLNLDPANKDFLHLKVDSPPRDAGAALTEVTRAIDGTPRPQGAAPDIGAYEFSTAIGDIIPPASPMDLGAF